MPPKTKLLPPDIPEELTSARRLTEDFYNLLADRDDIENTRFEGVTFADLPARRIAFRGCVFEKCVFQPGEEGEEPISFDFQDCAFRGCDFAGLQAPKASFVRVAFTTCRGVGLNLMGSHFRSVTIKDCQMAYVNMALCKLNIVEMADCDLSHASFGESSFAHVSFDTCRLSGADFYQTRLKGMDLRSNQIDGIVLGDLKELVGAKVTPLQASELALLLGVVVE